MHGLVAPQLALAGTAVAACNGREEYCGRKYSNITYMGAHNSAFVGSLPMHNQYVPVAQQLDLGVRFLQAQTHRKDGAIEMCHTYCWELDAGSLDAYLRAISAWMGAHPDEVVTLLLTNGDKIPVEDFDAVFQAAALTQYVMRPPQKVMTREEWPTLQEMIDAGTRLVVFMDRHTDQTKVDYIINEFDYFWETPWGIIDKTFPTCVVDRPPKGDPAKLMGLMNHMLNFKFGDVVFPNQPDAASTNSKASIEAQVARCIAAWSQQPTVVLLDWVNIGEVAEEGLALNGLS
ncbi:tat pathway signal sequence [Beauveria bassiana ARSEF 2860]|uniref:Tat pathway signal sequence n=1 Tax=Beauveria bassiana (strain ARSEF 2860) TaxID=655819 RepID=J4KQ94_BEAB2|nr:tat pathway signal sequence [Beauveria bassiana ARSEF 2860]EJP68809.1 tat pathway signal sequence [Beauveria bassiana ARSEF 2860]